MSKITEEIKAIVEEQMRADDKTTAVQLHKLLNDKTSQDPSIHLKSTFGQESVFKVQQQCA